MQEHAEVTSLVSSVVLRISISDADVWLYDEAEANTRARLTALHRKYTLSKNH